MDIINASEEIKNEYRMSGNYQIIKDDILRIFSYRQRINKLYPSNKLKDMLRKYNWNKDKETNMMLNSNEPYKYISNELIVLVMYDLNYIYKQHHSNEKIYYFNISINR